MDGSSLLRAVKVMVSGYLRKGAVFENAPRSCFDQPGSRPLFMRCLPYLYADLAAALPAAVVSLLTRGPVLFCLRYMVRLGKSNVTRGRARNRNPNRFPPRSGSVACRPFAMARSVSVLPLH